MEGLHAYNEMKDIGQMLLGRLGMFHNKNARLSQCFSEIIILFCNGYVHAVPEAVDWKTETGPAKQALQQSQTCVLVTFTFILELTLEIALVKQWKQQTVYLYLKTQ